VPALTASNSQIRILTHADYALRGRSGAFRGGHVPNAWKLHPEQSAIPGERFPLVDAACGLPLNYAAAQRFGGRYQL